MLRSFLLFQIKCLLLTVGIGVLIGTIGFARGDKMPEFIVQGLDWSGLACIVIGCFSLLGAFASRGSFEVQYSRSAGTEGIDSRTARDVRDMLGSFYYLILFSWTGVLQLLASALIHAAML